MAWVSGVTGTATPHADIMGAIRTLMATTYWTYVETVTAAPYTADVYKSPAAHNSQGADFYVSVISDGTSYIYLRPHEGYDSSAHKMQVFAPTSTSLTPSALYKNSQADATPAAAYLTGCRCGVSNGPGSTYPNTSTHYSISLTNDRIILATRGPISSDSIYAGLYESAYSGSDCMYLPGVAGIYASAPDSAALSITGDIDIRCKLSHDGWRPAANSTLVAKWGASPTRSYQLYLATNGTLGVGISIDGTAQTYGGSSVAITPATAPLWVRWTLAVATGKANFYTSTDGTSWSALGTEQTLTGAPFTISDNASAGSVGALGTGGSPCAGRFYRAQVRSGIDGTVAFDADFTGHTGATSFTESSANGATVTLNGGITGGLYEFPLCAVYLNGGATTQQSTYGSSPREWLQSASNTYNFFVQCRADYADNILGVPAGGGGWSAAEMYTGGYAICRHAVWSSIEPTASPRGALRDVWAWYPVQSNSVPIGATFSNAGATWARMGYYAIVSQAV